MRPTLGIRNSKSRIMHIQVFYVLKANDIQFKFNDQTKASQNLTLINKAFILYSQYLDCNLSFLLVLCLLVGNRPSWSG